MGRTPDPERLWANLDAAYEQLANFRRLQRRLRGGRFRRAARALRLAGASAEEALLAEEIEQTRHEITDLRRQYAESCGRPGG